MLENIWFIAAVWMGLALIASLISIRIGISVALIEILTFGTISALFGLQNKIIDQDQYTILVSVVILSAFVPTLIAQKFFQPTVQTMHAWGRLYKRRLGILSVEDVNRGNNSADRLNYGDSPSKSDKTEVIES